MKEVNIYIVAGIKGRWPKDGHIGYALEYYRENGKILGKCEKVKSLSVRKGVENLSDIDIQKALNNARANLSKNKAKLEQAGDDEKKKASALALIQKWETTQKAIEEEIEARKKK